MSNRVGLSRVVCGTVGLAAGSLALATWLLKLRMIGAKSKLKISKLPDAYHFLQLSKSRTEAFLELLRGIAMCVCLREGGITAVCNTVERANDAGEISNSALLCVTARFFCIAIPLVALNIGTSMYGPEKVFDCWIGMIRPPLDWFGTIYIGGKQVASIFYHTTESISSWNASLTEVAPKVGHPTSDEVRDESRRLGSRSSQPKEDREIPEDDEIPEDEPEVLRLQVLDFFEDMGTHQLLRGMAQTPEEKEAVERLVAAQSEVAGFARAKMENARER